MISHPFRLLPHLQQMGPTVEKVNKLTILVIFAFSGKVSSLSSAAS